MPCRARSTSDTTRTPTSTSTCQPGAAQNAGGRCLGLRDIPMRGCGAVSFGAGWTPTPNAPCLWWIYRTRLIPGSGLPQRGHRTGSACAHPHAQDPRNLSSPDRVDSERAGDSPVRLPLCRLGKIRTMSRLITMVEVNFAAGLLFIQLKLRIDCLSEPLHVTWGHNYAR